ncbi:hypothetical protein C8F01DRAFT_1087370 [Mycena amicta]|nr:hypothetical protein C8F01DRAFT_1087370 [Mycena amicta]
MAMHHHLIIEVARRLGDEASIRRTHPIVAGSSFPPDGVQWNIVETSSTQLCAFTNCETRRDLVAGSIGLGACEAWLKVGKLCLNPLQVKVQMQGSGSPPAAPTPHRAHIACVICRKHHIKCVPVAPGRKSNGQPCARCTRKGLVCEYLETAEEETSAAPPMGMGMASHTPMYAQTPHSAPARSQSHGQSQGGRHWSYLSDTPAPGQAQSNPSPNASTQYAPNLAAGYGYSSGDNILPSITSSGGFASGSRSRSSSLAAVLGPYDEYAQYSEPTGFPGGGYNAYRLQYGNANQNPDQSWPSATYGYDHGVPAEPSFACPALFGRARVAPPI